MSVREPGVHVEFVMHPVVHGLKSQEEGREVCVDEPHVKIRVAGNDKEEFFGPVNEQIRARFPEEWGAFEKGLEAPKIGTPIDHWPRLSNQPSLARLLKNLAIFTVEDMAGCTDAALQKVGMGGQKLREDAKRFLELARATADSSQVDTLRQENAMLKEQFEAMKAQIDALTAAASAPKRGRPAKQKETQQ